MAQRRPDRTLGPGHDEFWDWCGRGELRLQRCASCAKLLWPVMQACEHCGSGQLAFVPVSGRANLVSWCTFERDYYRGLLPIPWDTVLVELEEGPLFISNPEGFGLQDVAVGMAVKLKFIDCEDSAGPFSLPVFERA